MKKSNLGQLILLSFLLAGQLILIWPWFQEGFAPHSASFEPSVIVQARFVREHWPDLGWYPHWYLGLPFKMLGSPLVPYLLALLNWLVPSVSLWFWYRLLTGGALLQMTVGVFLLGSHFGSEFKSKGTTDPSSFRLSGITAVVIFAFFPSVLYLFPQVFTFGKNFGFWPWQIMSLALLGMGQRIIALAVLPLALLAINQYLKRKGNRPFLAIGLVCLLALADLSSLVSLGILTALLLVSYLLVGKQKQRGKRAFFILAAVILVLSPVYSPRFWWVALSAPSLAGKRTLDVVLFLWKSLSIVIPIVLATISTSLFKKSKDNRFYFLFLWVFVYGFLTVARFLADYDFWQDYTGWGIELQMGLSLFVGRILAQPFKLAKSQIPNSKSQRKSKFQFSGFKRNMILITVALISPLLYLGSRKKLLKPRQEISQSVEGKVAGWLKTLVKPSERVFLSGSPVFWQNALVDVAQVRGGVDRGATHPFWDHAAFQIREGEDPELAGAWLEALGAKWLVVHGPESTEPYLDFKRTERFQNSELFSEASASDGDSLYQVKTSLARQITNPESFFKITSPTAGDDALALSEYNQYLGKAIGFEWLSSSEVVINLPDKDPQAISLAITYDPGWKAYQNEDQLIIKKDSLGQMVIFTQNNQRVRLLYSQPSWEKFLSWGLVALGGGNILLKRGKR
ncbi:hypothetical protein ACFLZP_03505 [Patescibacteria group bacterium]